MKKVSLTPNQITGAVIIAAIADILQIPATIAFLTGTPGGDVQRHVPPDCVSVYVPTTPNPTGGYFVIVARKDVIELDMSVDQALKYIISMGVVPPAENR